MYVAHLIYQLQMSRSHIKRFNFFDFRRDGRIKPQPRQRFHSVTSSTILSNDEFIHTVTVERRRDSNSDPDSDRFPAEIGGDSIGPPSYNEIVAEFFEPPPSYQQAILSKVSDENVSLVRTEAWVRTSGDLISRRNNMDDTSTDVQGQLFSIRIVYFF